MTADPYQFEEPIGRLRRRIEQLAESDEQTAPAALEELRAELTRLAGEIYSGLTPWQTAMVARHPSRPYTLDFISLLFEDFVEVHGDRRFADDTAIVAGFGRFEGKACAVIGHQKGRDTKEKIRRNFAMPRPEGYRKALRVMKLAEKFGRPIITFIDTPGAYPGVGAEERGQAEAIAVNLREMAGLEVPMIATITGEGGSGGALALGMGNRVMMLEHAVYSVISPEGCAAILWKNPGAAQEAAEAMKITAPALLKLGVIDEIVPEPAGGAHSDHAAAADILRARLRDGLETLTKLTPSELVSQRYDKFRAMGVFGIRV